MIELNDETKWILGRPNFYCGPIAELFRKSGESIPANSEEDQAFVIHWFLCLYEEFGESWSTKADEKMAEMQRALAEAD